MNDKYFLDTNIFIYSFDSSNPEKQSIASKLIQEALDKHNGCTGFQVVQEFLNVATRKFESPLSSTDCQRYLNAVFEPLCEVFTNIELYHKSLDIMDRWKFSFYDSLIISAALHADCAILFTEDLQHGQKVQNLKITNPFRKI